MGNSQTKGQVKVRPKKQVHWKAAERPGPPGKPQLVSETEITPDIVTIRWDKPKFDGGSTITGYLVEHKRTGSPHWVRATPLLVKVPELTLSGLEPGWRYQFRVSAQNAVGMSDPGEISEPLTVTLQRSVITAPKFMEELKDTTALENEMVEFVVHFVGQPIPKICWFKDGFEIFSSRRTRIITENDKSVLTIHQVALSDEGEIKCTATNKAGHVSTKANIKIEAPPVIRLPRQYEDGLLFELDEVIRLKVSIAGRPQPLVFWSLNGESIQTNERYEIMDTDRSSTLKIAEAKRSDRGEYQIRAVNKLGEDFTSFLVTVTDKPKPPKNLKVVMSLGKSVTLSWELPDDDGGCKIGNYIVEYYRLGWNVWLKASTCRQLSHTLSELIEGSEYKFRVKAESPYGISDPSDETDVIFIPDPKRGLISPPARSRSQPRNGIRDTSPIPPKRRSNSSTRNANKEANNILMLPNTVPTPPKRDRSKSSQRSPESSPLAERKYMFDRTSLTRELSYGSPDIQYKKNNTFQNTDTNHLSQKNDLLDSKLIRERSSSIISKASTITEQSYKSANSKNDETVPTITRERSPSIINQLISNILPRRSSSPSPSSLSPSNNNSPINTPVLPSKHEEVTFTSSLKGDHLDRLSPNVVHRRLSSPTIYDQKETSPDLSERRSRSPSLVLDRNYLSRNKSPSPISENRSPSPSKYSITTDDESRRGSIQSYRNDMLHGSSEFMLVLVDDQEDADQDFYLFEDSLIPPPLSLSAPELGAESELFMPLKTSVSSTEILHERAFARFLKESEEEEQNKILNDNIEKKAKVEKVQKLKITEIDDRRPSIPKILINSKDNEEIVGLERQKSFKRRLSAGVNSMSQYSWAKRRHSLRNANENIDLDDIKNNFAENIKDIGNKLSLFRNDTRNEPRENKTVTENAKINFVSNNRNQNEILEEEEEEEYEESIYSISEESEDESEEFDEDNVKYDIMPPSAPIVEEEETYHPRVMSVSLNNKYEDPFEILTKPSPLPDPNFIPKPILKNKDVDFGRKSPEKLSFKYKQDDFERKSPEKFTYKNKEIDFTRKSPEKFVNKTKEPEFERKSPEKFTYRKKEVDLGRKSPEKSAYKTFLSKLEHSLSSLSLGSNSSRSRSPSPTYSNKSYTPSPDLGESIPETQMISAAEAAQRKRLNRQPANEEYKVVDHYTDILNDYGTHRRPYRNLYLNRDDLKAAAEKQNMYPNKIITTSNFTSEIHPIQSGREKRHLSPSSTLRSALNAPEPEPIIATTELRRSSSSKSLRSLTLELEEVQLQADMKVRLMIESLTGLAMFIFACWLYLFKNPIFAIPIFVIMVYRQVKSRLGKYVPNWMKRSKNPDT